jgi:hypothetical protein
VFRDGRSSSEESLPGSFTKLLSRSKDVEASFCEAVLSLARCPVSESLSLLLAEAMRPPFSVGVSLLVPGWAVSLSGTDEFGSAVAHSGAPG